MEATNKPVKESYRSKLSKMAPKFTYYFKGKTLKVTKFTIYDSDSIQCQLDIGGQQVTYPCRLLGFDAIEKKQKKADLANLTQEDIDFFAAKYKESEELLESLINGKELTLECDLLDLYGRILSTIYVYDDQNNKINVNQKMIDSNLVFSYDGGRKLTIKEQIEFLKQHHKTE